jgi:hypothetical protein
MQFDETQPEPIVTPDTPNRTRLNSEEAPSGYRLDGFETFEDHYDLLNKINSGTHIRAWDNPYDTWTDPVLMRRADNLALFDAGPASWTYRNISGDGHGSCSTG